VLRIRCNVTANRVVAAESGQTKKRMVHDSWPTYRYRSAYPNLDYFRLADYMSGETDIVKLAWNIGQGWLSH
jgi:hypothetical protein